MLKFDFVFRSMNGVMEFVDTQDMTVMSQTEHFMATDVEWDPTGDTWSRLSVGGDTRWVGGHFDWGLHVYCYIIIFFF